MDILKKVKELELVIAFQAKEIADLKHIIASVEAQVSMILHKSQQLIKATEGKAQPAAVIAETTEKIGELRKAYAPEPVKEPEKVEVAVKVELPDIKFNPPPKIDAVDPANVPDIKIEWDTPPPVTIMIQGPPPVVEQTLPPVVEPAKTKPVQTPLAAEINANDSPDFAKLHALLVSSEWPSAVDPSLICDTNSDQDKDDRAEGILDLIIDVSLENLNFLDFGCGEGHVVNKSRIQKPKMSVGFEMQTFDKWQHWQPADNLLFTTDWEAVEKHAPYNVILLYDVLDHIIGDEVYVVDTLRRIKKNLAPNGKVYVRNHPWCCRHGTHLYQQVNKAFIHLIFTEAELKRMNYTTGIATRKIIHPLSSYQTWFKEAGFNIHYGPQSLKETVEPFFKTNPIVLKRIREVYAKSPDREIRAGKSFPFVPLEQQFIDYILT